MSNTETCIRCCKTAALPYPEGHGGQLCQECEDLQEREYRQWEAQQRAKGYLYNRPDRAKQIIENALSNESKRRIGLKNSSPDDYYDERAVQTAVLKTVEKEKPKPRRPRCDIHDCNRPMKFALVFETAAGRVTKYSCEEHAQGIKKLHLVCTLSGYDGKC
jgi:hypothetical protein